MPWYECGLKGDCSRMVAVSPYERTASVHTIGNILDVQHPIRSCIQECRDGPLREWSAYWLDCDLLQRQRHGQSVAIAIEWHLEYGMA